MKDCKHLLVLKYVTIYSGQQWLDCECMLCGHREMVAVGKYTFEPEEEIVTIQRRGNDAPSD